MAEVGKPYFPATSEPPFPEFFVPSTEDRAEARERQRRVAVSVWDVELTTPAQACAIRWQDEASKHDTVAFALRAEAVRAIGRAEGIPLDVIDDRHDPAVEGAGAEGHCAILGLDCEERAGKKAQYRSTRDALARVCRAMA